MSCLRHFPVDDRSLGGSALSTFKSYRNCTITTVAPIGEHWLEFDRKPPAMVFDEATVNESSSPTGGGCDVNNRSCSPRGRRAQINVPHMGVPPTVLFDAPETWFLYFRGRNKDNIYLGSWLVYNYDLATVCNRMRLVIRDNCTAPHINSNRTVIACFYFIYLIIRHDL